MTPKKKSPNESSVSDTPKKKLQLAPGKQLVSFEIESAWRRRIDAKVDAGHYDSFSAYMRHLVRRDLGIEGEPPKKVNGALAPKAVGKHSHRAASSKSKLSVTDQ